MIVPVTGKITEKFDGLRPLSLRKNLESATTEREKQSILSKMHVHGALDIAAKTGQKIYVEPEEITIAADPVVKYMSKDQIEKAIQNNKKAMQEAAKKLDFIQAARYRDEIIELEKILKGLP